MIHEEKYTVKTYQVDMRNRIAPAAVFGMMQESASIYCLNEKISLEYLNPKGLTWMLLKQHVRFQSYPQWNSVLNVKTWPRNKNGLRALRDYLVTDEQGNCVAESVTNWVLIDTASKKLVKIDDVVKNIQAVEESVFESNFKIRIDKHGGEHYSSQYNVKYSDIDINLHVNNLSYIKWCLDAVPFSYQTEHILKEFTIEYMQEIGGEISVTADVYKREDSFYHELKRGDNGEAVCRAQTAWQAQR